MYLNEKFGKLNIYLQKNCLAKLIFLRSFKDPSNIENWREIWITLCKRTNVQIVQYARVSLVCTIGKQQTKAANVEICLTAKEYGTEP